jgi:NAD-dependent SIR2 family protein deacetylase
MIEAGTAPAMSKRLMHEIAGEWAAKHEKHYVQPKLRLGDFDTVNSRGSIYEVTCVRCSLTGEISIPEHDTARTRCPRCQQVPESEWQSRGQAGLLPPEKPTKRND